MNFNKLALGVSVAMLAPSVASAEPVSPLVVTPAPQTSVLRTGLQIPLTLAEPLTTKGKMLRVGQRVQLVTSQAITLGGRTVIPVGSPAVGEITDVRNKGMWGKSGHINGRVLYLHANGRQIRLTGQFDEKGTTGTAAVVGSVILLPVVGFFTTGTSAKLPVGTPVTAFLDEDIDVAFAAGTGPDPMVVPAIRPK